MLNVQGACSLVGEMLPIPVISGIMKLHKRINIQQQYYEKQVC
jgi:hypothetical protein